MKQHDSIEDRLLDYQNQLEKNPRSKCFVPLAALYRLQMKLDQAVQVLEEGLHWHPRYGEARSLLAQTLWDLGRAEKAYVYAKKVLETAPKNLMAQRVAMQAGQALGRGGSEIRPKDSLQTSFEDLMPPHPHQAKLNMLHRLLKQVRHKMLQA